MIVSCMKKRVVHKRKIEFLLSKKSILSLVCEMRSVEDEGCFNLEIPSGGSGGGGCGDGASFEIHKGNDSNHGLNHRRTTLGKPTPSKWDDAQKWLVKLSRGGEKSHKPRDSNADNRRLVILAPDPSNEDEEQAQWDKNMMKKVDFFESISVRDMGTEMTPMVSHEPSRTGTPARATTPARCSPIASASSTPVRTARKLDLTVKNGGTTRLGGERVESNSENLTKNDTLAQDSLETRAMAWDEAKRAKYMARFKREEVKIQARENHEKRKAEMEMKRMEAKAERAKCRAQEKHRNKLASARRIAEEKRAKAEVNLNENGVKISEKADYIRRNGHLPSSFFIHFPSCCS